MTKVALERYVNFQKTSSSQSMHLFSKIRFQGMAYPLLWVTIIAIIGIKS